ncbi:MAG: chemotaxis protein CheW, partial [Hyphomicrobiales bacterium]
IDSVGDVLVLDDSTLEANPANLDPRWSSISNGVHRLDGRLMVILDVERVLDLGQDSKAA